MSLFHSSVTRNFFVLIIGGVFVFSGCVNLKKAYPDIVFYSLALPAPSGESPEKNPVKLRLADFTVDEAFADRYLTYRTGESSFEQDFYNQWVTAPELIVAEQTAVWFSNSTVILKKDSEEKPDYEISGEILSLCGDYRVNESPAADLRIRFTVTDPKRNSKIVFQKVYSAQTPLTRPSPALLTEGLSNSLKTVLIKFDEDMKSLRPTAN